MIDVSGSMFGKKLRQTKEAMKHILDQMEEDDRFNIIAFSDQVYYWNVNNLVRATESNINAAKNYIDRLKDLYGKT